MSALSISDNECPICQTEMVLPTAVPACGHKFCFLCIKGVSMLDDAKCPICRGGIDGHIFDKPKVEGINLKMDVPVSPVAIVVRAPKRPSDGDQPSDLAKKPKTEETDEEDVKPDVAALQQENMKVEAKKDAKLSVEDVKPDIAAINVQNANQSKIFWLYKGRHGGWWRFDPRVERDIEDAKKNGMPITEIFICGHAYVIDFSRMIQYRKDYGDRQSRDLKRVDEAEFDNVHVKGVAGVYA